VKFLVLSHRKKLLSRECRAGLDEAVADEVLSVVGPFTGEALKRPRPEHDCVDGDTHGLVPCSTRHHRRGPRDLHVQKDNSPHEVVELLLLTGGVNESLEGRR